MVGLYRGEGLALYERVHYSRREHVKELEEILRWYSAPGARLLDLGCSGGLHALEFAGRGFRVTGVDIEPSAIELAKLRARALGVSAEFHCLDVGAEDPRALGTFDLVYSLGNVLSHLPPERLRPALVRLRRSLRGGGTLLFNVLIIDGPFPEEVREEPSGILWTRNLEGGSGKIALAGTFPPGVRERFDVWGYRVDDVLAMLREAGFENVEVSRDLGFPGGKPREAHPICLYFRALSLEASA